MKYMLLMQGNKQGWSEMAAWSPEDVQVMMQFMEDLNKELTDNGELVQAVGLTGPDQLKTVQVKDDGEAVITDGPYPETKEVLAGYWIVDVKDEERVIELATRISKTPGLGGQPVNQPVEVHPVPDQPGI
jgi:hypothetical protein